MGELTPRTELKFSLNESNSSTMLLRLAELGGVPTHPGRWVTSTYFDTENLELYNLVLEGITPRHKLRIRCYGHHNVYCGAPHFTEIKETSEYGRAKSSAQTEDWKSKCDLGIELENYGHCTPALTVQYRRAYFSIFDARLTLDSHISYSAFTGRTCAIPKVWESSLAIELKSSNDADAERLINSMGLQTRKFSKYERGVEALHLNQERNL